MLKKKISKWFHGDINIRCDLCWNFCCGGRFCVNASSSCTQLHILWGRIWQPRWHFQHCSIIVWAAGKCLKCCVHMASVLLNGKFHITLMKTSNLCSSWTLSIQDCLFTSFSTRVCLWSVLCMCACLCAWVCVHQTSCQGKLVKPPNQQRCLQRENTECLKTTIGQHTSTLYCACLCAHSAECKTYGCGCVCVHSANIHTRTDKLELTFTTP